MTPKEYTAACSKLLVQYKSAIKLVQGHDECPNVEAFVKKFKVIHFPACTCIKNDKGLTKLEISS